MPFIDAAFHVQGKEIPADHAYDLYSAVCKIIPFLHEDKNVGVHPIAGRPIGQRLMALTPSSQLTFRLPSERLAELLPLAGKRISLGPHVLRVGIPRTFALQPVASLHSRLVIIKGFLEPDAFLEAAQRQLTDNGIEGIPSLLRRSKQVSLEGKTQNSPSPFIRRTLRIKDKEVVGFALRVESLSADDSLRLQEIGVGGRRHMGCGIFVPVKR